MRTKSRLGDILHTIAERGRRFLAAGARGKTRTPLALLEECCDTLLSSRGEASGMALAQDILARWRALDATGQRSFLHLLLRFGPDVTQLEAAIARWQQTRQQTG